MTGQDRDRERWRQGQTERQTWMGRERDGERPPKKRDSMRPDRETKKKDKERERLPPSSLFSQEALLLSSEGHEAAGPLGAEKRLHLIGAAPVLLHQ